MNTWLSASSREMAENELWSFSNALFFLILLLIVLFGLIYGLGMLLDVKKIKANWAENRCNPTLMPFASYFGFNTKENFEFCMGKIFNTYSQPFFSSSSTLFSNFTGLLGIIFNSINSLRNTIATLNGGISTIFQEFTERISNFFFKLRISAIRMKTLISRMYAILFSVMYMGLSGITGMTSFTNTFLFSFLDTFCFPGNTQLYVEGKGNIQIKDIQIGDILLPTGSRVTGLFRFKATGQPIVKIGSVIVSTNHYIEYKGNYITAGSHPNAIHMGLWNSTDPLYCLNTHDNKIPIDGLTFLDYDETSEGDSDTMKYIQNSINASTDIFNYKFTEYSSCIHENTLIKTYDGIKEAKTIKIGDKLITGGEVVGIIRREVNEICELADGTIVTPSTLFWNSQKNKWNRFGESYTIIKKQHELVSFIITPNSQIELENNLRIRDYMELCSPDSEMYYTKFLQASRNNNKTIKTMY